MVGVKLALLLSTANMARMGSGVNLVWHPGGGRRCHVGHTNLIAYMVYLPGEQALCTDYCDKALKN